MPKRNRPPLKLTRRSIAVLPTPEQPLIVWDTDLAGFGLSLRPTGSKTFICQYRPGGGRNAPVRRMAIGDPETVTVEQARGAAKAILARVTGGADPAAERSAGRKAETVAEIVEAWMADRIVPDRKPRTAALYRQIADTHVLPHLGRHLAVKLNRQDVARFRAAVATGRRARRRPDAKPRTTKERTVGGKVVANRAVTLLASALAWAIRQEILPAGTANPAAGADKSPEKGRERFLTDEELLRLGEALCEAETVGLPWKVDQTKKTKHTPKENPRQVFSVHVTNAIRLLILTGCRLREVLHARWEDVDLQRGFLNLPESKTGRRAVPLSNAAIAVLLTLPKTNGRYIIASESAGTADEKPRRDLKRIWTAVTRRAGLEGVRLHDLRHTTASVGASSGLGLPIIASLLGHKDVKTTARYAHLAAGPIRRAADSIGASIALAMGLPAADVVSLDEARRRT